MGKRYKIAILISAMILAGAIRYNSAQNNLRIDEVWSMNIVESMDSPFDAFRIAHDNNHILNSIYLYYFGNGDWWLKYHLLSVIAGTASVGLIGWLGFQTSAFAGISAVILGALSIPMIVTSTEARGYALSIFFALASFALFKHYGKNLRINWIILFWLSIILGLLSHLIFFYIYAAFLVTSFFVETERASPRNRLKEFLLWHGVPSLFTLSLFFLFVKNLVIGGAPYIAPGSARFIPFMTSALNLRSGSVLSAILSLLIFAAVLGWIAYFERRQSTVWIFHIIVVGLVPTASCFADLPFFHPLYLSFSLPFLYLLLASILSKFSTTGRAQFACAVSGLLMFVGFSISGIQRQIEFGPGAYLDSFQYVIDNSIDKDITLTSDSDWRYGEIILPFYGPFVKTEKNIYYVSNQEKNTPPEWLILTNSDPDFIPESNIKYLPNGLEYQFRKSFPNASVYSGWSTFLYQRSAKLQYGPI